MKRIVLLTLLGILLFSSTAFSKMKYDYSSFLDPSWSWGICWNINDNSEIVGGYVSENVSYGFSSFEGNFNVVTPTNSAVTGINDIGDMCGWAMVDGYQHAAIWKNGTFIDLDPLGTGSNTNSIHNSGWVIGASTFDGVKTATAWDPDGNRYVLPVPSHLECSQALDINSNNEIVGCYHDSNGNLQAALWLDFTLIDIKKDAIGSWAYGINEDGEIAGGYNGRPIYWDSNLERHILPGIMSSGSANDINDNGVIIGNIHESENGNWIPVSWEKYKKMSFLPIPSGVTDSRPWVINNRNEIVGTFGCCEAGAYWFPTD